MNGRWGDWDEVRGDTQKRARKEW